MQKMHFIKHFGGLNQGTTVHFDEIMPTLAAQQRSDRRSLQYERNFFYESSLYELLLNLP